MNVTLIGMAGAGKSYIGRKLAEKLNLEFLDIDKDVWEVTYGKPIQKILDDLGEKRYLEEEERLIIEATAGKDNLLISPPGSVAYQKGVLEHLKNISTVVYLQVPFHIIETRLKDTSPRAIIGLNKKTLRELYDERHPLYEKNAHFNIDTGTFDSESIVSRILGAFEGKTRL